MTWRSLAACRAVDPELFFPVGTGVPAALQAQKAKAVCRACPVREPCLEWALRSGEGSGIWGGTDPDERRALMRRRQVEHRRAHSVR